MSIISKFNKENPESIRFRRYIPNPGTLAAIDKYISEGKNAEAESLILRFMPNPAVVAELRAEEPVVVEEPTVEETGEDAVKKPELLDVPAEEPVVVEEPIAEETGEDAGWEPELLDVPDEEPAVVEEPIVEETGEDAVEEQAETPAPKKKTTKKKSSK